MQQRRGRPRSAPAKRPHTALFGGDDFGAVRQSVQDEEDRLARCNFLRSPIPTGHRRLSLITDKDIPKPLSTGWLHFWASDDAVRWAVEYFAQGAHWNLTHFTLLATARDERSSCLGEGGDGKVWLAMERTHGIPCALKELKSSGEREIFIHATLDHPRIVQYYTHFFDTHRETRFAVLEFCAGGNLLEALPPEGGVHSASAAYVIAAAAEALEYLQGVGVVYADLKTTNIMLDARGRCKLGDFGGSHWSASSRKLHDVTGTVDTQPPEMMTPGGFDKLVDNWALGVLIYRLLVGKYPFSIFDDSEEGIREAVTSLRYSFPPHITPEERELMRGLLRLDPAKRLSIRTVLGHRWLTKANGSYFEEAARETSQHLSRNVMVTDTPLWHSEHTWWDWGIPVTQTSVVGVMLLMYVLGAATVVLLTPACHGCVPTNDLL
eukprot:Sspe_Gene.77623::Locus_48511_Transcript_2_3_Confidence_0.333_Length_1459::g.77623::m.77623/K08850/AURKX; aurora kinase, other